MNGEQAIWVQGLRWLGVLPAAVVGCLLGFWMASLVHWLNSSASDGGSTWVEVIFGEVIGHGAMGAAFVGAGTWMAPRGRTVVALVLSAVMLMVSALALFGSYLQESYWPLIGAVSAGVGSIAAAVFVVNDQMGKSADVVVDEVDHPANYLDSR